MVSIRLLPLIATLVVTPAAVLAQEIQYDANDYLYAEGQSEENEIGDPEPTLIPIDPEPTLIPIDPDIAAVEAVPDRVSIPAATRIIPSRTAPVVATYGANYAPPVRPYPISYGSDQTFGSYGYAPPVGSTLPGGGQLVSFDRTRWLSECRTRLASHAYEDRPAVIGELAGAALGNSVERPAITTCEEFLDAYIARAQASSAPLTTVPNQQYFLVPVSVEVPSIVRPEGAPLQ